MSSLSDQAKGHTQPPESPDFEAGLAHFRAGRLERADALFNRVLRKMPGRADVVHLLGAIASARGRHERAIQLFERALQIEPNFPEAHVDLGNVLRSMGRPTEAANSYTRAVALRPDFAPGHCNLACLLNDLGDFEAALESAATSVRLMPGLTEGQIALGIALVGRRRFGEAEAPYRRAIALQPNRAMTHSDLGLILTELGRFDEAVKSHRRAITLAPDDPARHFALGKTLFRAGDLDGSEASHRRTVALAPTTAIAWSELGWTLGAQGRFEEALSCYHRALELDPDLAEAQLALALTGQRVNDEAQIERLRACLANPGLRASDRIGAGFALGTLLDNSDRYDDAFPYFAEANAIHYRERTSLGERFDILALRHEVNGLIERCTPELFSLASDWGNRSDLPVFIVGMPRSGTSLVEQIAASHSRVFGAGERKEIGAISTALLTHNRDLPLAEWDVSLARALADRHIAQLQTLGSGAARVIDKLPDNILFLGVIAALFPGARVIFCRRDARDTCLSCYFQRFTEPMPWAYNLADCGLRALEVERLAANWRTVLPLKMFAIDYERLVVEPEEESRRLIDFLGLEWEPACLDFHLTQRPVRTASSWQVRQPLYSRSVGRWRHYERYLGPLFQVLEKDGAVP